jgi:hypothetical protein
MKVCRIAMRLYPPKTRLRISPFEKSELWTIFRVRGYENFLRFRWMEKMDRIVLTRTASLLQTTFYLHTHHEPYKALK